MIIRGVTHELGNLGVLVRRGIARPVGPRAALRMGGAALRWRASPATLVAVAAAEHGDRTALIDDRGTLTFRELHQRSNALAGALAADGVGSGDTVALVCRNHRWFVDALFAATKLGAGVLLMNTSFAGPQLAEAMRAEGVTVVIHDAEFTAGLSSFPDARRYTAWPDGGEAGQNGGAADAPALDELIRDGTAAPPGRPQRTGRVVILTSGTTGTPKGVARPAPRSLDPVAGLVQRVPVPRRRPQLLAAPIFHTWGLSFLLLGLQLGAKQILRRRFAPAQALADLEQYRCATFVPVPVMLHRIVNLPMQTLAGHDTSALAVVAASGAALTGDLATEWMDTFGDNLYNIYGSTEVALVSVATPRDLRAAPGTAGRPARGTRVRLLDDKGAPVSRGVPGRIFVASGALFAGYTGGGGKQVVDGLMATGDVGYLDDAGRLFVRGRDDDMIVSGGENVFPAEVEDLLARHEGVAEAAAIGVDDAEFGQRLVAYVVPADRPESLGRVTEQQLRDHVKRNLAGYKVPREVRFVTELPRNATGKILKRELVSLYSGYSTQKDSRP